jgi:hypothetical protein
MSYHKKKQYLREFVNSIQREVLYHDPIFLLKVDLKPASKKGGVPVASYRNSFVKSVSDISYSKALFNNISKFSAVDSTSKSLVSLTLRGIINNNPINKKLNCNTSLIDRCKTIFGAHVPAIDEVAAFPANAATAFESNKKTIMLIDFDVQSEEQAEIASNLKSLFFDIKTATNYSKDSIIEQAMNAAYKLVAITQFTYAEDIVKPYGFLFKKDTAPSGV